MFCTADLTGGPERLRRVAACSRPAPIAARSPPSTTAGPASTTTSGCATRTTPEVIGPPRGRERLHPGADRAPGRPAADDLRRDQGPHPARPTCRCRPATAATGTTAAPSRARSTAPAAGSRSTDPDDWTPPQPAEDSAPDQPALPGEEVLLDLDALAEGHEFFSLGGSSVSPDGTLLAYSTDVVGDERYTSGSRTSATGELLARRDHRRPRRRHLGPATAEHLYYTTVDESWRSDKVWRHRLGTAQADDELVHHEDGRPVLRRRRPQPQRPVPDRSRPGPRPPRSTASSTPTRPRRRASGCFAARGEGLEYSLDHAVHRRRGRLPGAAQRTPAPDFEIGTAPDRARPRPRTGAPLVAHDPAVRLEDVDAFAGHLVVHQRSEGLTQLRILELGDADGVGDDYLVEFDHEIYTVGSGGNPTSPSPRSGSATRPWRCRRRSTTTTSAPAS